MKVILASTSSGSRGGGEIFLVELARGLMEAGVEPALWCSDSKDMDELCERMPEGAEIFRSTYQNSYQRWSRGLLSGATSKDTIAARKLWESWGADLIHLNKQNLEDGLDLYREVAEGWRGKSVATIHITQSMESLGARLGKLRDRQAKKILSPDGPSLLAVSDLRGKDLSDFTGRPAEVIYNGVAQGSLPKQKTDDQSPIHFVAVGRLNPQKRPLLFLETAREILKEHPECRFTWVGDGEMRQEFDSFRDKLGLQASVECAGWVENPEPFLSEADVFLHTAEYEGLPLAILEAFRAGLPCILPSSIAKEASAISTEAFWALEDPVWKRECLVSESRTRLGRLARELYDEHFTVKAMTENHLKAYESAWSKE